MTRILVNGASDFVGRALVAELADAGHSVRAAMRQPADIFFPRSIEVIFVEGSHATLTQVKASLSDAQLNCSSKEA